MGVDLGAKHIGVAIESENKVLSNGEIILRDDIKSNLETRKIYKRNRKNTKQLNNWCINDKVNIFGKIGFITGFTGK